MYNLYVINVLNYTYLYINYKIYAEKSGFEPPGVKHNI